MFCLCWYQFLFCRYFCEHLCWFLYINYAGLSGRPATNWWDISCWKLKFIYLSLSVVLPLCKHNRQYSTKPVLIHSPENEALKIFICLFLAFRHKLHMGQFASSSLLYFLLHVFSHFPDCRSWNYCLYCEPGSALHWCEPHMGGKILVSFPGLLWSHSQAFFGLMARPFQVSFPDCPNSSSYARYYCNIPRPSCIWQNSIVSKYYR